MPREQQRPSQAETKFINSQPKSDSLTMLHGVVEQKAFSLAVRRVPDSLPACPFTRFLRLLTQTTSPVSALPFPTCHYTSSSPPSILFPVLWTPRHLSALMPPSLLAEVTWCLNSSSLNSATSILPFKLQKARSK